MTLPTAKSKAKLMKQKKQKDIQFEQKEEKWNIIKI